MYVIGINEYDFLRIIMESDKVEKVRYECYLGNATIFPAYEIAVEILKEIKERKNEILFMNDNPICQILDKKKGKEFNVDELKIYNLVPTECKDVQ